MASYRVEIQETVNYLVDVEADTPAEAREKAVAALLAGTENGSVIERITLDIEER